MRASFIVACAIGLAPYVTVVAQAQSVPRATAAPDILSCSPAPCILPPVLASEGGFEVADAPIAADPLNPMHLIVGSDDFNCPGSSLLGFHVSRDGGSNWNTTCMTSIITGNDEYDPDINPSVGFDRNGVAYIAGDYSSEQGGGVVGVERSRDGVNWSSPVVALGVPDRFTNHSFMVVDDQPGSPFINRLYVSTVLVGPLGDNSKNQVAVSHSSDGGSTWTVAPVEPEQTFPASDDFTDMTVGKDGTVYVAWQHCNDAGADAGCRNRKVYTLFSKSTDGGDTWSSPRVIAKIDRGTTLCQCASGVLPNSNTIRVYNYPALGVDNSTGPHGGTLYVAMYSWTGTYMRVGVIRSTDGGDSWFKPVPIAPASANHDQFFPWLSVSPTGLVGVSWLDRRNDPANVKYQAFAAISRDGGQSFQPDVQLTTNFSDPNVNGYPQNGWMGDYTGNTWAGPNFVAAWMDSSNGVNMQDVVGGIRLH